tara:strand:- start:751 stop:981 length:231 start_codon:yes stop_codon:yes gene_type:complete
MTKEGGDKTNEILINGQKYNYEDLSEEQIYLLRQTQSCRLKANNLKFELDQVQTALNSFSQKLALSVNNSSEKKMG